MTLIVAVYVNPSGYVVLARGGVFTLFLWPPATVEWLNARERTDNDGEENPETGPL